MGRNSEHTVNPGRKGVGSAKEGGTGGECGEERGLVRDLLVDDPPAAWSARAQRRPALHTPRAAARPSGAAADALMIGSKGKWMHDTYGRTPRLLPKSLHDSFGTPPQKLPRIPNENHEMNWADAAKNGTEPSCPFEYAARLTEVMLLGVVAL